MSADLKVNSLFNRCSVVLMDDCLIKLEHERTRDRVRKVMYDRVESVVTWRRPPWGRIVVVGVLVGLPAALTALLNEGPGQFVGDALLALAAAIIGGYFYCGYTTIRITRLGQTYEFAGVFRPGRLRKFLDKLIARVRLTQQALMEQAAQAAQQASEEGFETADYVEVPDQPDAPQP